MANFTCDICGGNIKMQGSQGGVCQNCGMEYDIEAIRAKANAPQPKIETPVMVEPTPQQEQQSQEDRDALIIYLNDLRTMETILRYSSEKNQALVKTKNNKNSEIAVVSSQVKKAQEELETMPHMPANYSDKYDMPIKINTFSLIGLVIFVLLLFAMGMKSKDLLLMVLIFCTPNAILLLYNVIRRRSLKNEAEELKQAKIMSKEKELQRIQGEMITKKGRNKEWISKAEPIITELQSDITETKRMLKEAYDANIIPVQFRNIEGVYYLYDYLSTSNQSLAEALMQANLEAIKQKIDQMIRMQSKMLIEQQQTNARLADIQQTNQNILRTAALTARYAQVAAVNSELAVKLSSKQLAYQRADFWLK